MALLMRVGNSSMHQRQLSVTQVQTFFLWNGSLSVWVLLLYVNLFDRHFLEGNDSASHEKEMVKMQELICCCETLFTNKQLDCSAVRLRLIRFRLSIYCMWGWSVWFRCGYGGDINRSAARLGCKKTLTELMPAHTRGSSPIRADWAFWDGGP